MRNQKLVLQTHTDYVKKNYLISRKCCIHYEPETTLDKFDI